MAPFGAFIDNAAYGDVSKQHQRKISKKPEMQFKVRKIYLHISSIRQIYCNIPRLTSYLEVVKAKHLEKLFNFAFGSKSLLLIAVRLNLSRILCAGLVTVVDIYDRL